MSLAYPTHGYPLTYESQQFGPPAWNVASYEPAMYASGSTVAYWQPYKGWSFYSHYHGGLDIAGAANTPLLAVAWAKVVHRGIVYVNGVPNGGGNVLIIEIRPGTTVAYSHCAGFASGTDLGAIVHPGQPIAYMGMTGTATGPHVHLGLEINETGADGGVRGILWNPKLFMAGGAYAGDNRIVSVYGAIPDTTAPKPSGPAVTTAGGLPVTFTYRANATATILAGKPRRNGAALASKNLGTTSKETGMVIWGEVRGQDWGAGPRWLFGPQYIGSWRVIYIPLVDLKNRVGI